VKLVKNAIGEIPPAMIAVTTINVTDKTRKSTDGCNPAKPVPGDIPGVGFYRIES